MFPESIETKSLTLVGQSADWIDPLDLYGTFAAGSASAEGVFEYVPQEPYATPNDAVDAISRGESEWEDHEAALYAAVTTDEEVAGMAGLAIDWDRRTGSPGVILARPHWGQGYARECAEALTELAFEGLDLELVAIGHEEGNERSKRVVEAHVDRFGGQYDGCFRDWTEVGDEVLAHHRYTIPRAEYTQSVRNG